MAEFLEEQDKNGDVLGHQVSLEIENSRRTTINFVLEPWGEIYVMEPGAKFTVVFQGYLEGTPEIYDEDESITVYGWASSTATLFKNGEEIGRGRMLEGGAPRTNVPYLSEDGYWIVRDGGIIISKRKAEED